MGVACDESFSSREQENKKTGEHENAGIQEHKNTPMREGKKWRDRIGSKSPACSRGRERNILTAPAAAAAPVK